MVKSIFTGSRSALQMAVKRIDAASDTAARRAVSDITSSREFADAFDSCDLRGWPIAVLPNQIIDGLNRIGVISSSKVVVDKIPPGKLARKHPEVSLAQYSNFQAALDCGEILFEPLGLPGRGNRPTLVVLYPDRNGWWRYAIKINPGRLFITTVFRCSNKSREKLLIKKGIIVIRKWNEDSRIEN